MSERPFYHGMLVAGFGGQGVVLAGKLVATSAVREGREVVWTPSYGPEMRGGAVQCTVIVSTERIGSPEITYADSVMVMDQTSAPKFVGRLVPGGLLLYNSTLVTAITPPDTAEVLALPATQAAEELGNQRVANVLMLGALLTRRPVISPETLIDVMRQMAGGNEKLLETNLRALERGQELGR